MRRFALGVDYGTNEVRAVICDVANGEEIAEATCPYPSGEKGVLSDPSDPELARQNPADYRTTFIKAVGRAVERAAQDPDFSVTSLVGIGIDATGSSPLPLDGVARPLGESDDFVSNLDAQCRLWKDHTATAEAEEINDTVRRLGRPYLEPIGGAYSSEWFWAKILHAARHAPKVFDAAHTWVELQDYVPAMITGVRNPGKVVRGICAAGHKAMYHPDWGGLPDLEFLKALDSRLADLRPRLYEVAVPADRSAGGLCEYFAKETRLAPGTPVAVGMIDAHAGAVGAGVRPGWMVKIMGTSTCDILVGEGQVPRIPGVCGVVPDSVVPGLTGIEAGQSAVGDLFNWWARLVAPGEQDPHTVLNKEAARWRPGASGLLALDWNNGNRNILVDQRLSGLLLGQNLLTTRAEVYRALIEATAFGALMIVQQIEAHGVPVEKIVVTGGIAVKSPLTLQIYADVLNRPIEANPRSQTCALGAAVFGAVVGGAYSTTAEAIESMTPTESRAFEPDPEAVVVYQRLYALYRGVHDAFGQTGKHPDLEGVMKQLLTIRDENRSLG